MLDILIAPFWSSTEQRIRSLWRLIVMSVAFFFVLVVAGVGQVLAQQGAYLATTGANLAAIIMTLVFIFVTGYVLDRRRFADFGFHLNRAWLLDLGFGLALGALLMTGIFLVEWALGWITITGFLVTDDPQQPFLLALLAPLVSFVGVGIYEEVYSRGYLLRNLAEGLHVGFISSRTALVLAWLLSSVAFGLIHINNPNQTPLSLISLMLAGIFLGLGYVLTGELAIPIGLHTTWNFFQGNIFGFPVSGARFYETTLIAVEQGGPVFWSGGTFGPEGGLLGIIAILVGCLLTVVWVRARTGHVALLAALAHYNKPWS